MAQTRSASNFTTRARDIVHQQSPYSPSWNTPGVTFVDGLGQPIELRKAAVVDGVLGMTTSGLVQRDNLGRAVKAYHPFFTAGTSTAFATPPGTLLGTTTAYDVLDRPTLLTHPDAEVHHLPR